MAGCLYVVATPIGNLGDLSARARETLAAVNLIAAEDTRHSRRLLEHFGIGTPMISLHEHNEASRLEELLSRLSAGTSIALISDAGTPLLSDPGQRLVAAAADAGVRVSPIPGPAAAIAALSAAGMPAEQFFFEGFLPARSGARKVRLEALERLEATLVFYVAPHRLQAELTAMQDVFGGDRESVLARELSKIHESFYRGTLSELLMASALDPMMARGELVLLVAGAEAKAAENFDLEKMSRILLEFLSPRDAAKLLTRLTGLSRNDAYAIIQEAAGGSTGNG